MHLEWPGLSFTLENGAHSREEYRTVKSILKLTNVSALKKLRKHQSCPMNFDMVIEMEGYCNLSQ